MYDFMDRQQLECYMVLNGPTTVRVLYGLKWTKKQLRVLYGFEWTNSSLNTT